MTEIDIDHLRGWIGRSQTKVDIITPRLAASLRAIFNETGDVASGDMAPAGIQWCLAPDIVPMNALGPDGHPARGAFLPPVPFPRRMWAGGELQFSGPFLVGDDVTRTSTIEDVVLKTGRSGEMVFVTVRHIYETTRGEVLNERQDIVYRKMETSAPVASSAPTAPVEHRRTDSTLSVFGDPVLLFRYSALTFNGHRIHYDQTYATGEEGYPGLVFHGPLQANYLLRLAMNQVGGAMPKTFAFRSVSPLFAGEDIRLNARRQDVGTALWITNSAGVTTMQATAT